LRLLLEGGGPSRLPGDKPPLYINLTAQDNHWYHVLIVDRKLRPLENMPARALFRFSAINLREKIARDAGAKLSSSAASSTLSMLVETRRAYDRYF
jgi:hypothetical protein